MKTILVSKNKTCCRYILMLILLMVLNSSCANNNVNPPDSEVTPQPSSDTNIPPEKTEDTNINPVTEPNSNAVTLYLIIAADTNDSQIGKSVAVDSKKLQSLIEDIVSQSKGDLALKKIVLEADSVTNHNLMLAIDFPKVKPDDLVIFSYSGHGHRFQSTPTRWPLMDTPGSVTDFASVIEKIKNKNSRQFILLADCCNAVVERPERRLLYSGRKFNYNAIKQMFVISNARFAASGCLPGQFSYGDNDQGGLFTSLFISNLSNALLSDGTDWEELFQKTRQDVVNISRLSGNEQTPQYQRYN